MKSNVALVDRSIRMALGMLLLASPLLELRTYPYNLLGLVLIVTAAVGFCPLYRVVSALLPGQGSTRAKPSHLGVGSRV